MFELDNEKTTLHIDLVFTWNDEKELTLRQPSHKNPLRQPFQSCIKILEYAISEENNLFSRN